MVVMWSLWNHRNECLFRIVVPSVVGVTDLIKFRLAVWFKEVFEDHIFTVNDFFFNIDHIRFCVEGGSRGEL